MDKKGYMTGIDSMSFDNPQMVSKEGTQGMAHDVYHITCSFRAMFPNM